MKPWYKIVTFRQEVCEGRSFSSDELAIAFELPLKWAYGT